MHSLVIGESMSVAGMVIDIGALAVYEDVGMEDRRGVISEQQVKTVRMRMIKVANYELDLKLSEALYGTKKILRRNGKRIEVTIPPKTRDDDKIRLADALKTTDGCAGSIIVRIIVKPRPIINPATGTSIHDVSQFLLHEVGGADDDHVNGYLDSRHNAVYRQMLFEKTGWAAWVGGWCAKQANTFLGRACGYGFSSSFSVLAQWSDSQLDAFMKLMHGKVIPPRAEKKWKAVHKIAKWLVDSFQNECDFRQQVFGGALLGKQLDKRDVSALINRKLPFVGWISSHYVIRMLGGEQIEDDTWIQEFRPWAGLTFAELENQLRSRGIPLGFFDVVVWEYCDKSVKEVELLKPHLDSHFGFFVP